MMKSKEINNYETVNKISEDRYGTIYRGQHRQTGEWEVFKVLHPWQGKAARSLDRFRLEATRYPTEVENNDHIIQCLNRLTLATTER